MSIDLRMPLYCSCSGKCCVSFNTKKNPCFKPIFSGEYCSRNRLSRCKSFPIIAKPDGGFDVFGCVESLYKPLPSDLYEAVEVLNEIGKYVDYFNYVSPEVILHFERAVVKEVHDELPLHEILKLR